MLSPLSSDIMVGYMSKGRLTMKKYVIGILAHVDAGKTTLSEALLYVSGAIRTAGRVDHGSAFLDTFEMERRRGITIFSKQAVLSTGNAVLTLLDTPGHVDFAPEMERTLAVLDGAILVISGTDGVQSHTMTVWRLLRKYRVPTFLFINKMDLNGADRVRVRRSLEQELGAGFFDADSGDPEEAASNDEDLMEEYLSSGTLSGHSLRSAVTEGRVFPCWYGSALKLQGVQEFLEGMLAFLPEREPSAGAFGARVFKISRDEQGVRLTHMKITSGLLRVRDAVTDGQREEKVTRLRLYSGSRYSQVDCAGPGEVIAAEGLTGTRPGMGLGTEKGTAEYLVEPVLSYRVLLPEGTDPIRAVGWLRQLEDEEPQLHVDWNERQKEIGVRLMGPVQLEVLAQQLLDRFGLNVEFGPGSIRHRETIAEPVEGVGHYEPLRHYAEVHLVIEPGPNGSGIVLDSVCPEDRLDRNWQRLILTHLAEKQHLGVLTGSPLTDVKITLTAGRAHEKHTEGGDFRQATYRAVRHGLMQATPVLLEPWYDFVVTVPGQYVGRVMNDLSARHAEYKVRQEGELAVFTCSAAVSDLRDYTAEAAAAAHGTAQISFTVKGYFPCREPETVAEQIGYDPEADTENTADSVFCSHGAGVNVNWREVTAHMHLPGTLRREQEEEEREQAVRCVDRAADDEELRRIFERTYGPIRRRTEGSVNRPARPASEKPYRGTPVRTGTEYVLVDGYNIIFAWEELKCLAEKSLDSARARLLEILRNYQAFLDNRVILVFDAYKVKGNPGSVEQHGNVAVVYTREAETADMYIEKVSRGLAKNYRVRVATSDGLEQIIVLGHGCLRISAAQFEEEVRRTDRAIRAYLDSQRS